VAKKTLYNDGYFNNPKRNSNIKQGKILISLMCLCILSTSCSQQNGTSAQTPINTTEVNMQNNTALSQKVFVEDALIEDIKTHVVGCPASSSSQQQICIQICHVPPGNPSKAIDKILPLQAIKAHLNHGSQHAEARDYLGACMKESSNPSDDSGTDSSSETPDSSTDTNSTETSSTNTNSTDSTSSGSTTTTDTTQSESTTDSTQTNTTTSDPGSVDANTGSSTIEPVAPVATDTTSSTTDTTSTDNTLTNDISIVPLWCESVVTIDSNCDGIDDATGEPIF